MTLSSRSFFCCLFLWGVKLPLLTPLAAIVFGCDLGTHTRILYFLFAFDTEEAFDFEFTVRRLLLWSFGLIMVLGPI